VRGSKINLEAICVWPCVRVRRILRQTFPHFSCWRRQNNQCSHVVAIGERIPLLDASPLLPQFISGSYMQSSPCNEGRAAVIVTRTVSCCLRRVMSMSLPPLPPCRPPVRITSSLFRASVALTLTGFLLFCIYRSRMTGACSSR